MAIMAYKNHQSAQLGIEQLVLMYIPRKMQYFLDLHAITIRTCAACNSDRYEREVILGCGQKLRLSSLFSFSYVSHTKHKNKFVHKNVT